MVASRPASDLSKFHKYCTNTETLNEWISTVRYKKGMIRRQRRSQDLRVAAMLTTTIQRAETDLRRRQNERALKWAQLRVVYEKDQETFSNNPKANDETTMTSDTNTAKREEEIENLWNCELNGLHNLFNDLNQIKTAIVR